VHKPQLILVQTTILVKYWVTVKQVYKYIRDQGRRTRTQVWGISESS